MQHRDASQPLVIDTRELGRRPGSMVTVSRAVEAPEDLGTDVIAIPEGRPIELDLRLESVMEGVLVSGSARTTATGACVRCLDPVDQQVDADIQELFAYAERAARHQEVVDGEDEDDVRELEGDLIDLEPVLRDAVVPSLPFQPVCRDDCPGLCSECGAHLADDPDHRHEMIDPRWAGLAELLDPGPTAHTDEKRN